MKNLSGCLETYVVSKLLESDNWTLDEHLLFQRWLCCDGVVLRNRERVSCSPRRGRLSVHTENGADQFIFQTAFHVFAQAGMGTAAFVANRPGAEFVYVALVVPQDLLHGIGVPGLGRVAHRQRQQFTALDFVLRRWTALRNRPRASPISLSVKSSTRRKIKRCFAPAPADWQRCQHCSP